MEDGLGVRADLVEGDDGIFDVAVDGVVVFSKEEAGGFIAAPEMVEAVRLRGEKRGA